jgi:hypothetical protein
MRIAFSGTANTGKSTLARDFLQVWHMYSTPDSSYRDVIVNNDLGHSKGATQHGQQQILDFMVEQMKGKTPADNVVYDRCPLDNIIYSMWAAEKQQGDIDDEFIAKCIPIVRESIKDLDIIFWLPFNESIAIKNDNMRETDELYIREINNIFEMVYKQFIYNDKFPLFDPQDRPAMIELTKTARHERLVEIANYISIDGEVISPDEQWIKSLSAGEELYSNGEPTHEAVEQLLKQQKEEVLSTTGSIIV